MSLLNFALYTVMLNARAFASGGKRERFDYAEHERTIKRLTSDREHALQAPNLNT